MGVQCEVPEGLRLNPNERIFLECGMQVAIESPMDVGVNDIIRERVKKPVELLGTLYADHGSVANRDRKKPHGPSLPHHRAYGSRTRRFDELNYYLAAMFGSPRLLKYRAGNASASAGVLDKRHGPCADLLVFHASRTLTPRRRSSR